MLQNISIGIMNNKASAFALFLIGAFALVTGEISVAVGVIINTEQKVFLINKIGIYRITILFIGHYGFLTFRGALI